MRDHTRPAADSAVSGASSARAEPRTVRTGQGARRTRRSATLPSSMWATIPCPWLPTTSSRPSPRRRSPRSAGQVGRRERPSPWSSCIRGQRLELPLGFAHPLFPPDRRRSWRVPPPTRAPDEGPGHVDKMQGGTQSLCEIIAPADGQFRGWAKISRTDDPLVVGHDSLTGHVAMVHPITRIACKDGAASGGLASARVNARVRKNPQEPAEFPQHPASVGGRRRRAGPSGRVRAIGDETVTISMVGFE